MIVCCPACQTRFKVDPALLGPDGRKVRCAKCAHVWRVGQDGLPVSTGQFGLRAPPQPAAAAQEEASVAADIPPAPAPQGEVEGSGAPAPSPATEDTSLWARELIEREKEAKQVGGAEATAGVAEESQHGEAASASNMEHSAEAAATAGAGSEATPGSQAGQGARADAAAKQVVRKTRRKKSGQTFKIFLLVLCLVVLALFAIAALTGKFGPGGITPGSHAPTTGDVTPPEAGVGVADSKPGQAEGGGAQ